MNAVVELLQPRTLIPRIAGRDLRVLVDEPHVYLRCDDVEALAAVPRWGTGEVLLLDETQVIVVAGVEYYRVEYAVARAEAESLDPAAAAVFLEWVRNELVELLTPEQLENAHRPPSLMEVFDVARAARKLDADPGISIGRDRLFEHMAALGWIERNDPNGVWVVTPLAHARDWLVLRTVAVGPKRRGKQRLYPQIHVTPAGLKELHRSLAGLSPPRPVPPPIPTLFD